MRDDEIFDWSNDIRNGEKLRTLKYILEVMVISLIGALEGENSMISILNNRMYKDICVCVCVCVFFWPTGCPTIQLNSDTDYPGGSSRCHRPKGSVLKFSITSDASCKNWVTMLSSLLSH